MKKFLALLLVLTISFSCCIPAFAAPETTSVVEMGINTEFNPFKAISSFFNRVFEKITSNIIDSVRAREGELILENKNVSVSFANKTFNVDPDSLNFWCSEINVKNAGIAPAKYCDYVLTPSDSSVSPLAYRIAILNNEGSIYRTAKNKYHTIEVMFGLPANWKNCETVTITKYEWSEKEDRHVARTSTVPFSETIVISETIL